MSSRFACMQRNWVVDLICSSRVGSRAPKHAAHGSSLDTYSSGTAANLANSGEAESMPLTTSLSDTSWNAAMRCQGITSRFGSGRPVSVSPPPKRYGREASGHSARSCSIGAPPFFSSVSCTRISGFLPLIVASTCQGSHGGACDTKPLLE